jgi:hypothetical protein
MDPTGILTTFGLFYAFTGAFYGVPMAVQPMKAASAAVVIEPMEQAAIAGTGLAPCKRIDKKPVAGSDPSNTYATEASFRFGTAHPVPTRPKTSWGQSCQVHSHCE